MKGKSTAMLPCMGPFVGDDKMAGGFGRAQSFGEWIHAWMRSGMLLGACGVNEGAIAQRDGQGIGGVGVQGFWDRLAQAAKGKGQAFGERSPASFVAREEFKFRKDGLMRVKYRKNLMSCPGPEALLGAGKSERFEPEKLGDARAQRAEGGKVVDRGSQGVGAHAS